MAVEMELHLPFCKYYAPPETKVLANPSPGRNPKKDNRAMAYQPMG